tara:strand:- start:2535 stop:2822 length:288 start_codon:yes stop_codon:yes gene_type:complete
MSNHHRLEKQYSSVTNYCGSATKKLNKRAFLLTSLPGDHRELEPPDPIPNSAVKWFFADGSVGFPHARVGHCQVSKSKPSHLGRFFYDFLNMLVK